MSTSGTQRVDGPSLDSHHLGSYDGLASLEVPHSPGLLQGPLAWTGSSFQDPSSYSIDLLPQDLVELKSALAVFKASNIGINEVNSETFPLPGLRGRLQDAANELHNGKGFLVIRGMDRAGFTVEDGVVSYLGLASYVADHRGVQDRKGNVLAHVTDSKLWSVPKSLRHGIHSNRGLPFHSDMGADILCLHVRECAESGGSTYLSSATTILNDLLRRDLSLVQLLFSPSWPVQTSGQTSKFILSPLMSLHESKLLTSVDPARLGPHPNAFNSASEVPSLSAAQRTALEAFLQSAQENELRVPLNQGDILFLNNWALLHRRDPYEDDEVTSRHLVRMWLRNTKLGWAIPENMAVPWKATFEPGKVEKLYRILPPREYTTPKYTAGSAAFVIEDTEDDSH